MHISSDPSPNSLRDQRLELISSPRNPESRVNRDYQDILNLNLNPISPTHRSQDGGRELQAGLEHLRHHDARARALEHDPVVDVVRARKHGHVGVHLVDLVHGSAEKGKTR